MSSVLMSEKTVAMIFNRNLNHVNKDVQIFYKDDTLNVVSDFKYLGCFLKPDLCEDIIILTWIDLICLLSVTLVFYFVNLIL